MARLSQLAKNVFHNTMMPKHLAPGHVCADLAHGLLIDGALAEVLHVLDLARGWGWRETIGGWGLRSGLERAPQHPRIQCQVVRDVFKTLCHNAVCASTISSSKTRSPTSEGKIQIAKQFNGPRRELSIRLFRQNPIGPHRADLKNILTDPYKIRTVKNIPLIMALFVWAK